MMVFLEANSVALMYHYLSKDLGLDFVTLLEGTAEDIEKIDLNDWSDLGDLLGGGIFDSEQRTKLVNINELEITKKVGLFLTNLDSESKTYFYSTSRSNLKAAEKKIWKSHGFDYQEVKKLNKNDLGEVAGALIRTNNYEINSATSNKIAQLSDNINELINNLELVAFSENPIEIIKGLSSDQTTPAYMLQFDAARRLNNIQQWLDHCQEDEIQLTLSIIFSKLKKQSSIESQNAIKELIKTDQRIKTNNNVPSTVWFKYFLWQVKNNQYAF